MKCTAKHNQTCAYRIRTILRSAPWDHQVRSALDLPGLNVKEGEYLIAVNRQTIDVTKDPYAAFEGLEKQTVAITFNEKPGFDGSREMLVQTLNSNEESELRHLAWRHGKDQQWPPVAHFGPQAMLINGWAGSGGDALPWFFRTAGRGPLIGTRTWGGLIGPAVGHRLIDGGVVVVPPCRLSGPEGKWFAEGHGVDPDILVVENPRNSTLGPANRLEQVRKLAKSISLSR